jgi:hypothetical protein
MSNIVILSLQIAMALGVYIVIYRIYLQSWFTAQPFGKAVLPLLLMHVFRYLGLARIVPGQMDASIPFNVLQLMAWGDFASGATALLAAIAVHHRWTISTGLVALFSVVSIGDLIAVGISTTTVGMFFTDMGTMWFVLVLYAPVMLLAQIYIVFRLVSHLGGKEFLRSETT